MYPLAILGLLPAEITDFPTLSCTSTCEVSTLSLHLKPEKGTALGGEPPRVGHYREYPPGQQYFIPGAFTFPCSSVPVIHS